MLALGVSGVETSVGCLNNFFGSVDVYWKLAFVVDDRRLRPSTCFNTTPLEV